ncbi:MAG: phosphoribosylformylglycinamidine synthase [Candidatus Diapherotrites archaeon]|nr:phosphoribosylformylglycinamidine synthase [Candidatus Diapherotrites archaeon]
MVRRIEVKFKPEFRDARAEYVKRKVKEYLGIDVDVERIDVYTIDINLNDEQFNRIKEGLFYDPVTQIASFEPIEGVFDYLLEIGFLPGVKDTEGETAADAIADLLGIRIKEGEGVYTSTQYRLSGDIKKEDVEDIAKNLLANELIEHWRIIDFNDWKANGISAIVPKVELKHKPRVEEIDLNVSDEELIQLSNKRSLALSLADMKTIQAYFGREDVINERKRVGLGEKITDVELEAIAQTQSEHCKHRIFNGIIHYRDGEKNETIDSLFKTYIKGSTEKIAEEKDWIVSMFWDNAGVAKLNEEWNYIVKCETHNSPSALDPYGGAMTGIVGVYRDPMGTGKGSKIVAGTYGFCTGSPFYDGELLPRMHPKRLLDGIVEGVRDGGNKSGIPTVYGRVFFDDGFIGKPLVYVSAIGIAPSEINGEPSHEKGIEPNDLIVMCGGRVGKDGLHGVTESSLEHGAWITAGHVQIGDPFTQKKVHDFLLEARDLGLYRCITDCGGGGLSSAIGETARFSNGCEIHLDKVPLKYAGLDPWEILLSESQERMVLAVDPNKINRLKELAKKHDVEVSVIGKYTNSGKFHVLYEGKTVAYLNMEFLHGGFPRLILEAEWNAPEYEEPSIDESNHNKILKSMLSRINIASKEWIQRQYDHEVQGGSVIKPYIGIKDDVCGDAAVIKPILDRKEGLAIAAGINPKYSQIDAYYMAACALDEAIRRVLAVGANLNHIALNDNFCWPNSIYDEKKNPDGKHKLAQLVRANKALYEYTTYFKTPCISGKDSMFIDGNIKTKQGTVKKISGLPTLQFTAVAKVDDVEKCVTMDVKHAGDLVYIIGETMDELGASELYEMFGEIGKNVPKVNKEVALRIYQTVEKAIKEGVIESCHGCYRGGLAIALAEKAFAGGFGMEIHLSKVPSNLVEDYKILYSETPSRFVVTVKPENIEKFEEMCKNVVFSRIGRVREDTQFIVYGLDGNKIINADINELEEAWKSTFKNF